MNSQQKITVSVIIPTYNGAHYICDAVKSVLNQTFKEFEILVIDDGSTDNTKSLLEAWIKEGAIKYIYQSNKGLSGARNTGIQQAQGLYLKFLDCDDLLYPRQLELQVNQLKDKDEGVVSATDYQLEFESKFKKDIKIHLGDHSQISRFIEYNPCPFKSSPLY